MSVALGKKIPVFSLPNTDGSTWKSSAAQGDSLVIYFYPRDNTAGCTTEAEAFRDLHIQFRKVHTRIIGISADSLSSHEKFKTKLALPFDLLSDADNKVCQLFDVFKEKSMYGKKYLGIERSTFLFDSEGILCNEWRKVKVPGHAEEVLAEARKLK